MLRIRDSEKRKQSRRSWVVKNKEHLRAYKRKQYAENPEKFRERAKKWRRENPERYRDQQRKKAGLPKSTRPCPAFCECCGDPPGKRVLALDHCHATGKFRGWLCAKCNVGVGMLGDDPTTGIERLIRYKAVCEIS